MMRACSINISMLVSYDECKERVSKKLGPEASPFKIQAASAMVAAVFTAVFSLPFDNVKTKMQKQKALPCGTMPYSNVADCFRKSIAKEGVTGLWAGLPTYYFRVGPHVIITLIAAEFYRKLLGIKQS